MICLALALASAAVSAWSQDPVNLRPALAGRIVSNPANRLGQEELEAAMTDAAARPLFKKIRTDSDWGPEHPTWKELFPQFSASFRKLSDALSAGSEERLTTALANSLTEQELVEVAAKISDAGYLENFELLKQFGIDPAGVMRVMSLVATPGLYSQSEKDALKEKLLRLKGREKELGALKVRLEAALKTLQTPAFTKYQRVLLEVLSELLRRLESDASAKEQLQSFIAKWQDKVGRE